ncbi:hypothetical protein GCM10009836_52220 [Pseudonocardia ailaonensis]|uniref:DUF4383 domain-containing protein n=1 Tax=Pseudonocardia ailaonensis TaxID=367279 RepID=A0ABN2NE88_9PSEU
MSRRLEAHRSSWGDSFRHLDALHRVGALVLGLGLWAFAITGIVNRIGVFSIRGQSVLGLSSNLLLSIISLVVGAVLILAAIRGGRSSSTVTVVVGIAFMLSGIGNVLVLNTGLNVLAFRMSNVIFSLVAGGVLVILGAYGRFTGRLPDDNPYQQERHPEGGGPGDPGPAAVTDPLDVIATGELAEAERASVRVDATPAQQRGVDAAAGSRSAGDRVAGWRAAGRPDPPT